MSNEQKIRGNGKLLLTGEYFVLDGAKALALPTQLGQSFHVTPKATFNHLIYWESFDNEKKTWFQAVFNTENMSVLKTDNTEVSDTLLKMFLVIKDLNKAAFLEKQDIYIQTYLEFPRNWGLGSSSTLIYTLAKYFEIDPYILLEKTMGGSGYDIACAATNQAIIYQRKENKATFQTVDFNPSFSENLYFIYLDKKQNSREGIARYRERVQQNYTIIDEISQLTEAALATNNLSDFEKIIAAHETIICNALDLTCVKKLYFQNYFGEIKSLGAWGGDFVLATSQRSEQETLHYFHQKSFLTVLPYNQIILNSYF
jgi:mevalonate kinase